MKVLLIQPKYDSHMITPPLSLGYLASSLRKAGHDAVIEDCMLTKSSPHDVFSKHDAEIACVTAMTPTYQKSLEYIKEAKRRGIMTIIGGNHVTALPMQTMEESNADFGVIGEGEKTITELVERIESGCSTKNVRGVCQRNRINGTRELIENLDEIPFPAWDMIDPRKYPPAYHGAAAKRHPVAPIISSRGCPFNCYFCSSIGMWQRRIRFRSIANVVDEMEMLVNDFGVKEFHFEDDNLTMIKKHAMGLCNEIIERKLDITWACPNGVRIDKLDRELLEMMKKSGCHMLSFGIESGSQEILDKMNKNLDLKKVPGIVKAVKEVGINTTGFFIIGLPGDTRETVLKTINFAKSVPFDRAQFGTFTPLPGSKSFDDWVKGRDIRGINWSEFDMLHFIAADNLTKEELIEFQKKAFKEFYFRGKIIFKFLSNLKLNQVKWLLKRAVSYYVR